MRESEKEFFSTFQIKTYLLRVEMLHHDDKLYALRNNRRVGHLGEEYGECLAEAMPRANT